MENENFKNTSSSEKRLISVLKNPTKERHIGTRFSKNIKSHKSIIHFKIFK